MSVDDIMKINKMVQELLNQGVCSSREEAVKRAQEILNKNTSSNLPQAESRQSTIAENDSLERLRNLFDRHRDQTEKKFEAYKNALTALEQEIASLKRHLSSMSSRNASTGAKPAEGAPKVAIVDATSGSTVAVEQEAKAEPHPRKGNYKTNDVAIEKMFYFGNKR